MTGGQPTGILQDKIALKRAKQRGSSEMKPPKRVLPKKSQNLNEECLLDYLSQGTSEPETAVNKSDLPKPIEAAGQTFDETSSIEWSTVYENQVAINKRAQKPSKPNTLI